MSLRYRFQHLVLALPMFCLLFSATAFGQTGQGAIVGSVVDSTGAAVPGVAIRMVNAQTGFVYTSTTNPEWIYRIPYVNPGSYELTFEAQGFKKLVRANLPVRSTETARVDVTLELGSIVESVDVKSTAPLLETET